MKRQLIYHTHVNTNPSNKIIVKVKTDIESTSCFLDRVSRDGLTLSCNTETLHKLMPNKVSVVPKDPISLSTCFTLDQNIEASCRVIFARRLSKDQFVMELKFVDIDEQARQHLDSYIEKVLHSEFEKNLDSKMQAKPESQTSELYQMNEEIKFTYSKVA